MSNNLRKYIRKYLTEKNSKRNTGIYVDSYPVDELIRSTSLYTWFKLKNGKIVKVSTLSYDKERNNRPAFLVSIKESLEEAGEQRTDQIKTVEDAKEFFMNTMNDLAEINRILLQTDKLPELDKYTNDLNTFYKDIHLAKQIITKVWKDLDRTTHDKI